MVGTIDELGLHAEDGVAGDDTLAEDGLDALLNTGDVLPGDGTALDVGLELEVHATLFVREVLGLELDLDASVLAGTTGLLLVGVVDLGGLGDGLTVRDLGSADVGLDLELAEHAVDDDLEVELAHALDDGLVGLLVAAEAEGGILGGEADEGLGHLLLVGLGLGLDGDADDGLGELHLLEDDGVVLGAEGLAGGGVLEADEGDDVAGDGGLDFFTVVGVHLEHAADALVLLLDGVVDGGTGLHDAGVDAGEGEGTDEGVGGDLEGEGRQGLGVGRVAEDLLVVQGGTGDGIDVEGGGHVVDDGVEEGLDALVLEGGSGEDGDEGRVEGALADEALEGVDVRLLSLEVCHEDVLVELDGDLDELLAPLLGLGLELVVDEVDVVALVEGDAVEGAPRSSQRQTMASMVTRSTTPRKSDSVPMGICRTAGVEPSISMMVLTQK